VALCKHWPSGNPIALLYFAKFERARGGSLVVEMFLDSIEYRSHWVQ